MKVLTAKANTRYMHQMEKSLSKQGDAIRKNTAKNIDAMVRKAMSRKY